MNLIRRRTVMVALGALGAHALPALALEGPELYAGEKALYAEAAKEGIVVSFDTGPEWANWKVLVR